MLVTPLSRTPVTPALCSRNDSPPLVPRPLWVLPCPSSSGGLSISTPPASVPSWVADLH